MRRSLLFAAMFSAVLCGTAIAAQTVRLLVPVEISHMPADVRQARVRCVVSRSDPFDYGTQMGEGNATVALEGGAYSGLVGVDVLVTGGYPVGSVGDATADAHSYSCTMILRYRCVDRYGHEAWCERVAGATYATPSPADALFATASAPTVSAIGAIDRAHATTRAP